MTAGVRPAPPLSRAAILPLYSLRLLQSSFKLKSSTARQKLTYHTLFGIRLAASYPCFGR